MAITPVEKLKYQFSSILGSVLLSKEEQEASLARIAGEVPAPTGDDAVRAEAIRSAHMIAEVERSAEAISERIKALQSKKQAAEQLAGMLREDLTTMMVKAGVGYANDHEIEVFTRNVPDKIEYSEGLLDYLVANRPEFVRVKREIDKKGLADHFKQTGQLFDGMDILPGGQSVTIKR